MADVTQQVQVQCWFTSTETIRRDYRGRGAHDAHLHFHTAPEFRPVQVRTETIRTVRDGVHRMSTSTFTQLLSSVWPVHLQCCLTRTETILRTIRDGEPRTVTSTFTQFPSSETQLTLLCRYRGTHSFSQLSHPRSLMLWGTAINTESTCERVA